MRPLTIGEAQILLGMLGTFGSPLVISYIREHAYLNDWWKFGVLGILSLIVGVLQATVGGQLNSQSWIYNASAVFTAANGAFVGYRALGIEQKWFPKTGLIQQAKAQVESDLTGISKKTAQDLVDKNTPRVLVVKTESKTLFDPDKNLSNN